MGDRSGGPIVETVWDGFREELKSTKEVLRNIPVESIEGPPKKSDPYYQDLVDQTVERIVSRLEELKLTRWHSIDNVLRSIQYTYPTGESAEDQAQWHVITDAANAVLARVEDIRAREVVEFFERFRQPPIRYSTTKAAYR